MRSIDWPPAWAGFRRSASRSTLNETTRAYFERTAQMEGGQLADDLRAVLSGQTDPVRPR